MTSTPAEQDFIIIGGGTAGSALAGRLTEDRECRVTLLEAGAGGDNWVVNIPLAGGLQVPTRLNNWAFETVPQSALNGRCGLQPRGRVLGGSSAINAMVYIRGDRSDYDHWAALGNSGWSFAELLPYFLRAEGNAQFGAPWHGTDGPLKVSSPRTSNPLHQAWIDAARELGHPINDDFNGERQEGFGAYQVTQHNGERCSAARAYLLPHLSQRSNLQVLTGAYVTRIIFEGKRAIGVELVRDGRRSRLLARCEVIVSTGALQSPQVLMLSGVGDGTALRTLGIPVVHHLPGVGENLQDHVDYVFGYHSRSPDSIGLSLHTGLRLLQGMAQFRRHRRGLMTSNYAECGGFLKTRPELRIPNVQLHLVIARVCSHARDIGVGRGLSCHVSLLRPQSRGTVRLANADPRAAPLIDPRFLQHPDDMRQMIEGFRLTREMMEAPSMRKQWTREAWGAEAHTDSDVEALLRARADSIYHCVGSCRMGNDPMAVVDAQLRVHGVTGLRVVDASIMPTIVGGNTNAPSIMIGEKAADLICGRVAPAVTSRVNQTGDAMIADKSMPNARESNPR
jgi:choline dehydrogenase-like flavoprotein